MVEMPAKIGENKGKVPKEKVFEKGEKIWIKENPKANWEKGEILERRGDRIYMVRMENKTRTAHSDQLRPRKIFNLREKQD
jgi:hypothetical protein